MSDPEPNLISDGTYLGSLDRVPGSVERLWTASARREGSCVRASGLVVRLFGDAFDKLGLAEMAREEVARHATSGTGPGPARLRYHLYALVDRAGGSLAALAAFVRGLYGVEAACPGASLEDPKLRLALSLLDPPLASGLDASASALRRLSRLQERWLRRGGLAVLTADDAERGAHLPEPALGPEGVAPAASRPPRTLPAPEFAAQVVADVAAVLDRVATAAAARIEERGVERDLSIEVAAG